MEINQAFTILQNAGGVRAARIITESNPNMSRLRVWWIARALRRGVPVAKIIGQKWFWGLRFYTNRHTLDPRPDTETLVAAVIADCATDAPNILDLGTGTGCIIGALVHSIHGAHGVGIDRSRGAVRVARRNMRRLGLDARVQIMRASFNNPRALPCDAFDIIVANPPYIAVGDRRVDAGALHDPWCALYAKNNGLAAYESIAPNAWRWACPGAKIYLEIGMGQAPAVRDIFTAAGWEFVRSESDLGGIERVLVFRRPVE